MVSEGLAYAGPFFVRKHVDVNNYTRPVHTSGVQVTYICDMTNLIPNGISHSVVPERPIKNYNEWMQYIRVRRIVTKHHIKRLEAQNQS